MAFVLALVAKSSRPILRAIGSLTFARRTIALMGSLAIAAALTAGQLTLAPVANAAAGCSTTTPAIGVTVTCTTAGGETISVPAGAVSVEVVANGGGGAGGGKNSSTGASGGAGASGAKVQATLPVAGMLSLTINVGAGGVPSGAGGSSGKGGGSTRVAAGFTFLVVAGGGGGGGIENGGANGGAGGSGGRSGASGGGAGGISGGGGNVSSDGAGGAGGTGGGNSGTASFEGSGGLGVGAGGIDGGWGGDGYGGGGGGGFGGAGGGVGGGGGGGGSYVNPAASPVVITDGGGGSGGAGASASSGTPGAQGGTGSLTLKFLGTACSTPGAYTISSESDLRTLAVDSGCRDTGRTFTLSSNLILTSPWTSIGTSASPFKGTFDGNSYAISGLSMALSTLNTDDYGLFGVTQGATLKNLTLSSVYITNSDTSADGPKRVGALVGYAQGTTIQDINVSGSVDASKSVGGIVGHASNTSTLTRVKMSGLVGSIHSLASIGGIAGFLEDATVTKASSAASVSGASTGTPSVGVGGLFGTVYPNVIISESSATGNVLGSDYIGGVVGEMQSGSSVTDTFATGSVMGNWQVGGLVGKNLGQVSRSYVTGTVVATQAQVTVGGIGGQNYGDLFTDMVWNPITTGQASPGVVFDGSGMPPITATGLTSDQMRYGSNFAGWNFTSTWGYECATSTFPTLRWINTLATADACPLPSPEPEPVPVPAPTPSSEETPSVVPAVAEQVSQVQQPVVVPTSQSPGTSAAVIGGQETEVVNQPLPRGQGIEVVAGPVEMTVRSVTPSGQSVPVAPDGSLVLARTGEVPVSGGGLEPSSTVSMTLFSDPISLGSVTVGGDGSFTASPVIPSTVPVGAHTLQLTGRTKTGEPFELSIGVLVATPAAAVGADPVLSVQPKVVKPGASVAVMAHGVQAGCRVTFTLAGERGRTVASKKGVAQAHLMMPKRLPKKLVVKATVGGVKCSTVTVSKKLPEKQ